MRRRVPADTNLNKTLTVRELDDTLACWVRNVQEHWYSTELTAVSNKGALPHRSALRKLTPLLDGSDIFRVGGRLKHALLSFEEKHPTILPASSHLTKLIVDACHRRTLQGAEYVGCNPTAFLDTGRAPP